MHMKGRNKCDVLAAVEAKVSMPNLITQGTEKGDLLQNAYFYALENLKLNTKKYDMAQYNKTGLLPVDGRFIRAGERYEKPWTRDCAINTWNAASLLEPTEAQNTIWAVCERKENGRLIIQNDNQWWDKLIWVTGAWSHYTITGDIVFLQRAYEAASESLEDEFSQRFNTQYGLFCGPAVMADGISGYPSPPYHSDAKDPFVLCYAEARNIMVLSTNCIYYNAARLLAKMAKTLELPQEIISEHEQLADGLHEAINKYFWIDAKKNYGYFIHGKGNKDGELDRSQEAIGISFAILFGIADEAKTKHIMQNYHSEKMGIVSVWPHFSRFSDERRGRHNACLWPIINGFWAEAAAHSGETEIFRKETESLALMSKNSDWNFYEVYHPLTGVPDGGWQIGENDIRLFESCPHQTWSATAFLRMIFRGLFGLSFDGKGIIFSPTLPKGWGSISLYDITYRQMKLNICLKGSGNVIHSFLLDANPQDSPYIKANLTGEHIIEITLSENKESP